MSAACKLFPLLVLSLLLTSCTMGQVPPGGQVLLLQGERNELTLLSDWREKGEKKTDLSPLLGNNPFPNAFQMIVGKGKEILTFHPDGSWEITPLSGGPSRKGSFEGKAWLAIDHSREEALVQVKGENGFQHFLWNLESDKKENWTPIFPAGTIKQDEQEGCIALEGDLQVFVTKDSQGIFHLWTATGTQTTHLAQLPDSISPFFLPRQPWQGLIDSWLSVSPDRSWVALIGAGISGKGNPIFILNRESSQSHIEYWTPPIHQPRHIQWSSDSRYLLISSNIFDGSGRSFLFELPSFRLSQINDLAFFISDDWLLLYHTAFPGTGGKANPPVEATLRSLSGEEIKVDLSGYIRVLDVYPKVLEISETQ